VKCPICKQPVDNDNPEFPFCSQRCRTIDLGNWASGKYAVPGPPVAESDTPPGTPDDSEDE